MEPIKSPSRLNPSIGGLAVVLIILVGLYLFTNMSRQGNSVNCETSPAESRKILHSDFDVSELWSLHINLPNLTAFSPLVAANSLLMVAQTCDEVTAIALKNGNIIWHSEKVVTPSNLALDVFHNQVYVTAQEQLRAINNTNGKTDWINTSQILKKNAPPVSVMSNFKVIAYARHEGIRYVDPATGDLSDPIELPEGSFLLDGDIAFTINQVHELKAIDTTTNKVKWISDDAMNGGLSLEDMRPDIQENLLILRKIGWLDHPIVLDKNTGKKLWYSANKSVVSNVSAYRGNIYVLTSYAELLVLNAQSGAEVGIIKFVAPTKTELLYSENGIGGSWIAAMDDMIFVYFQDTDVLAAYKIKLQN